MLLAFPPLSLQEEFAGVVARVELLRGRMGESTRQVEGLFEALLSESFGGEFMIAKGKTNEQSKFLAQNSNAIQEPCLSLWSM